MKIVYAQINPITRRGSMKQSKPGYNYITMFVTLYKCIITTVGDNISKILCFIYALQVCQMFKAYASDNLYVIG